MIPPSLEDVQRAIGDHYEVLDLAGVGGMGAVFRARHRALGHLVAVKVLPPEVATSRMRQDRFKREASLAAQLSHPNIVPVYEFDTRDGLSFLIMPFVRGVTLESALAERPSVPVVEILRLLREVGAALDVAHRRGVVHRDVKPANIMIEEDTGRPLLTDFGVAQDREGTSGTLTAPGSVIGTPDYMAPEQMVGLPGRGRTRRSLFARSRRVRGAHRHPPVSRRRSRRPGALVARGPTGNLRHARGGARGTARRQPRRPSAEGGQMAHADRSCDRSVHGPGSRPRRSWRWRWEERCGSYSRSTDPADGQPQSGSDAVHGARDGTRPR